MEEKCKQEKITCTQLLLWKLLVTYILYVDDETELCLSSNSLNLIIHWEKNFNLREKNSWMMQTCENLIRQAGRSPPLHSDLCKKRSTGLTDPKAGKILAFYCIFHFCVGSKRCEWKDIFLWRIFFSVRIFFDLDMVKGGSDDDVCGLCLHDLHEIAFKIWLFIESNVRFYPLLRWRIYALDL